MDRQQQLEAILQRRIMVLDGAMGTVIQQHGLAEDDFRGELLAQHPVPQKGNNDVLTLTRPQLIASIHRQYLEAGADIIETNTFSSTTIAQREYGTEALVEQLNRAAAQLARQQADDFTRQNPAKPRFVAGSMGPTGVTLSMSPDVANPALRTLSFDQFVEAYAQQAAALIEGGVDVLLIETIFDTLNAKAALFAIANVQRRLRTNVPVMLSATVADTSGRLLAGQTIEAFVASVEHYPLLSVGLNCSFGPEQIMPYVDELSRCTDAYVSVHPNAGLPNQLGLYDQTPELMASAVGRMLTAGMVNIVGGCCGTTPDHIARIAQVAALCEPRRRPQLDWHMRLSGLEPLEVSPDKNFINVGERTNVAGSKKFARLIAAGQYAEAVQVAREQVDGGAQAIDVCMDDAMIDAPAAMTHFLNLIASEPEIARVPIMIDSSRFEVIEAGLKCAQGKCVVNSISLKEGEEEFIRRASIIRQHGAAVVVMLFDEQGQGTTTERRIEVARRSYEILTQRVGFRPTDIVFDPNILAIGTGMAEHDSQAVSFIETCRWVKNRYPGVQVSGGVSNLSFAFRGNNAVREAIHAVFLYHAIAAGMNMGIVNPSLLQVYSEIEPTLLALTEDLVLNRRPDATERLLDYAQGLGLEKAKAETAPQWRNAAVAQRIKYAMIKGDARYIATDTLEAYHQLGSAMAVIDGPLMAAMTEVGELFGSGRMFLPQVVKTARVMKEAVAALEPYMDQQKQQGSSKGTVVLATVKGDVHDIGKNIVGVVLACNGYKVIDLGVMVPAQAIADAVRANNADVLGLSGLITPSLDEMVNVVQTLKQQGINVPVQIGGATTSELHTALKIAPAHSGPVVYGKDASQASSIIANLLSPSRRHEYMDSIAARYEHLRTLYHNAEYRMVPIEQARSNPMRIDWSLYTPTPPQCPQVLTFECYPIAQIAPHIDWTMLLYAWDIPGRYPEVLQHPQKGPEARKLIAEAKELLSLIERQGLLRASAAVGIFPAASRADDILIYADATRTSVRTRIPMLRSQQAGLEANPCLADFIAPEQLGLADWMGCFALTTGVGAEELSQRYRDQHDDFKAIMVKILADRLADAFAEHLHQLVRTQFWGYCPDTVRQGIRPAPGYPSCPDHRGKRIIFDLIDAEKRLGMGLTQSMAMTPNASVAGFYFAHPQAHYFSVGRIDTDQLADYAQRLGISPEEATRLMKIS